MDETERAGPDQLRALCAACGSCCDGTVFSHIELTSDDVERLGVAGGVSTHDGRPVMFLGCQHHAPGIGCAIYDRRPGKCGTYSCHTLEELEAGSIDFGAALGRVRSLRSAVGEVTDRFGKPPAGRMLEVWVTDAISDESEVREAKVLMGALRLSLGHLIQNQD